jgi:hypothetical protein
LTLQYILETSSLAMETTIDLAVHFLKSHFRPWKRQLIVQYILETSSLAVVTTIDLAVHSRNLSRTLLGPHSRRGSIGLISKPPNALTSETVFFPTKAFFGACSCSSVFFDAKASLVLVAARVE